MAKKQKLKRSPAEQQMLRMFPDGKREGLRTGVEPEGGRRIWGVNEDLSLMPVLLACRSGAAYSDAVVALCTALNRPPSFTEANTEPTIHQVVKESRTIIERRFNTDFMDPRDVRANFKLQRAVMMSRLLRDRRGPLGWAEKTVFLQAYARKVELKRPCISFDDLMHLINRPEDDEPMVIQYITQFRRWLAKRPDGNKDTAVQAEVSTFNHPMPTDPKRWPLILEAMRAFIRADPGERVTDPARLEASTSCWARLCMLCEDHTQTTESPHGMAKKGQV